MLNDIEIPHGYVRKEHYQEEDRCDGDRRRPFDRRRPGGEMEGIVRGPGAIGEDHEIDRHDQAQRRKRCPRFQNLSPIGDNCDNSQGYDDGVDSDEQETSFSLPGIDLTGARDQSREQRRQPPGR